MIATQEVIWIESEEYLTTGELARSELAWKVLPYARAIFQVITIARFLLFLLQLKWHRLSRLNFYLNCFGVLMNATMPIDQDSGQAIKV